MRAEILTIGDELCRGEIVDTNASWLAQRLWELQVTVTWMTSCRDEDDDMRRALTDAAARADLVVVSGGLGPTEDDRTVDVLSALLGVDPVIDEEARDLMERRFAAARFTLTPNNMRQVRVPRGARVLRNRAGLAPGFEVSLNGVPVVCMPGVPREVYSIFDDRADGEHASAADPGGLAGRILALREARGEHVERIARRIFRVFGLGESHVGAALEGITRDVPGASIHYQASFPEVLVKVVVRDRDRDAAAERLEALASIIHERLGERLYGTDDDSLPAVVGRALVAAAATVATAESCTGGLVGARFTDVGGSSAYYLGGAITYTNEEKTRQLGVDPAIFISDGAVSEACVIAMAEGTRARFGADYAVATSGVAGPGGGTVDKPVGTVWIAVIGPDGARTKHLVWPMDRIRVRELAAHWALALVLAAVNAARAATAARAASAPADATAAEGGDQ